MSVSCTPASGSAFNVGTTAVVCTATDAASRQAVCGFDVVVKGVQLSAKKFLAVGDSLTEGENGNGLPNPCPTSLMPQSFGIKCDDTANAYPTKLQAMLESMFPGQSITVANRGKGGMKTRDSDSSDLSLIDQLPGYIAADRPEGVLILVGYNDLSTPCGAGYSSDAVCDDAINVFQDNMREIIHVAKTSSGVRYVFVSTLTPGRPGSRMLDSGRIRDANKHLENVIASEGAVLADSYPAFLGHESEYVSLDGLHLNPPGYQVIAQTFFDKILATVPQTNPQRLRR